MATAPTEAELAAWIGETTGAEVAGLERLGYGASRATYVVRLAGGEELVARVDTGDGPMAGTELSLVREAEVYRALAGTGVRIPGLRGVGLDGRVLLAERAPGRHELDGLDAAARSQVFDDYLDALAELHRLDPSRLDLPSYRRPADGPDHARQELDLWGTILTSRTTRPWPLARFALRLLGRRAVTEPVATVLCHGDVGPGNFLHDGQRVTALLDWEFSHVGDPMDDLAWWVFRGHDMAGDCGDLPSQLARWSAATGWPVVPASIEYYRAVVMLRWLVSVAATLDAGGGGLDRSVHFALVPVLAVRLPQALADLAGVTLPPPPSRPAAPPGPGAEVIGALRADLAEVILPAVTTPEARRRARAALLYVSHVEALDRHGSALLGEELDDLGTVLGDRPATLAEGEQRLADQIARDALPDDEALAYFWRSAHRQVAAWPLVASRALAPPTPIPDVPAAEGAS